jgi:hypothetical protein
MVRLVTIVLPAFFASAFASSFALRRLRKSSRHLECWTCSMRTWMRFLAMRPPICCARKKSLGSVASLGFIYRAKFPGCARDGKRALARHVPAC